MLSLNWKQGRAKKLPDFCKKLFTTPQRYDIIIKQSKNRPTKKAVAVRNRQAALWGYSSAGRALDWQSRGQRFDPAYLHQINIIRTFIQSEMGSDLLFILRTL